MDTDPNFKQEFDHLTAGLIEIGKTDEFLTVELNSKFNDEKRNIRAREIGVRLSEMGGMVKPEDLRRNVDGGA